MLETSSVYSFEPLHGFYLGISKLLKKCLSERLRSENLSTTYVTNKNGMTKTKSFKMIRMLLLNGINKMLSHMQHSSPAKGLQVDFSSSSKDDHGNGLYNQEGNVIGMLEAKNFRSIDMIFPFAAMFIDRCCDEISTAATTSVIVQYTDIVNICMSYDNDIIWRESKVQQLEKRITKFKNDTRNLYAEHQASELRTEKFHALDHIADDIRRLGSLRYSDAGLYEYAHTKVKGAYRSGSKRKHSAMDETIHAFMKDMKDYSFRNTNDTVRVEKFVSQRRTLTATESIRTDCAMLVNTGKRFTLSQLKYGRAILRSIRKADENGNKVEMGKHVDTWNSLSNIITDLISDVGEEGSRVLYSQLAAMSKELYNITVNECIVSRVVSGYVPGVRTPTASNYNGAKTGIVMKMESSRKIQRIVSGRGFYNNPNLRQDCVLIAAEGNTSTSGTLWVGKVLAFLRIINPNGSKVSESDGKNELMFIQYFDIIPPQDEIDRRLECIRLQWCRDEEQVQDDNLKRCNTSFSKWFDLLQVSSIRGMVHVVRGDYGLGGTLLSRDAENVPWYDQHFYINRFYFDSAQQTYEVSS